MITLFQRRHALPLILQSEVNECGLACLAMIAGYHGKHIDIGTLRNRFRMGAAGASVQHLLQAAGGLQLQGRPLKLALSELDQLALPVVLHWDLDHFVVLQRVQRHRVTIHDPAIGIRTYTRVELDRHFTGIAIEFLPQGNFVAADLTTRLSLRQMLPESADFYRGLLQIFLLSFLIQVLSLLSPLYMQLVIDQGIARNDMDLLPLLACLFLVVLVSRIVTTYFRGLLGIQFTNQLGFQMLSAMFVHLLRLPLSFFERREMGDIVSRFGSLENIKQLVSQELITVIVDGLFSLITLVLLFLYSPLLAWLTAGFMSLFAVLRYVSLGIEKRRRQESLICGARQHSRFMENVRAITTIKNYGIEPQRVTDWQGVYAESINAGYHLARFQLGLGTVQALLFGLDNLLAIYLGATLVGSGALTLGQLMSFVFLKQHFTGSITAMLPKLAELRLMRLELERVADIALEKPEYEDGTPVSLLPRPCGALAVHQLGFRYRDSGPPLLAHLDFTLDAGSSLSIVGPSGCGKSTLLKLLLGLERPETGEIRVDGRPLGERGMINHRTHVAAILHSEGLLAGDLAYNIRLDHGLADPERLRDACERAGIWDLIHALPLGFDTRIGEMGSQFSAGQTQRLLLARAFYRRPQILVLDEALSHLGNDAAMAMFRDLVSSPMTVILVTHNPTLAALADQVLDLNREKQYDRNTQQGEA